MSTSRKELADTQYGTLRLEHLRFATRQILDQWMIQHNALEFRTAAEYAAQRMVLEVVMKVSAYKQEETWSARTHHEKEYPCPVHPIRGGIALTLAEWLLRLSEIDWKRESRWIGPLGLRLRRMVRSRRYDYQSVTNHTMTYFCCPHLDVPSTGMSHINFLQHGPPSWQEDVPSSRYQEILKYWATARYSEAKKRIFFLSDREMRDLSKNLESLRYQIDSMLPGGCSLREDALKYTYKP